ncbi:MAG TPA: GxxExxY protein [Roseiflexaceae bacterium]|nr:GxxExxY protein [Roseiflexaceae bacterium]
MTFKHSNLTDGIINAFYQVYNALGYGFLEKVYENALVYELRKRGFEVVNQAPIKVYYDGLVVGDYYADVLVNSTVVLELKVAQAIGPEHEAQLLNYLRATRYEVGLILNFGPKPQIKRKIYDLARKHATIS